jgi:hypothetical protein
LSQQDNEVLTQALEYYLEMIKDERGIEGTKAGKELITRDNLKIDNDIGETLSHLKTGSSVGQIVMIELRRQVICDALGAYEAGLKRTRETYWKNVEAHPKLESTDEAIRVTQDLKRQFCSKRLVLLSSPVGRPSP